MINQRSLTHSFFMKEVTFLTLLAAFFHPGYFQSSWANEHTEEAGNISQLSTVDGNDVETTAVVSPSAPNQMYMETEVAIMLDTYGGGIILFCGTIFNVLSIILLRRKRMRGTTTSLYLVALAATDLVQVITGQATRHWVRALIGLDPPSIHTWYCKLWYFVIRVANSYSNWVLASVTVERCIAILLPLQARAIITRKSAKIFLSVELLVIVLYYCHSFISYKTIAQMAGDSIEFACVANMDNYFVVSIRPWTDFVFEMLLPGVLIVICNIIIIVQLNRARKHRLQNLQGSKADDHMNSMVVMLVTVSIAYLILTTPMHVNFVLSTSYPAGYQYSGRDAAVNRLVWAVALFLHYINHSINFLLYVISGREFRAEFKALFCGERKKTDVRATSVKPFASRSATGTPNTESSLTVSSSDVKI